MPGLMVVDGIHPELDVEAYLKPWFKCAKERLDKGPESQMPEISAWRKAYSQMGLKPSKYRSAAEALLRRFKREGDLPRLHPLVDICNALSIAFALPVAVFDLAGVKGFIEVCRARGTEQYLENQTNLGGRPQFRLLKILAKATTRYSSMAGLAWAKPI